MSKAIDLHVRKSGHLDVGDGHKLYWEDWGNPSGFPVMHFHGGPGGGFSDSNKLMFDPKKHRVIFFDQRGSGKSTPFASLKQNTTQKLVEDTEKLRKHLGIEQMHLVGGSWGSTMVLAYAIAYPSRVKAMLAWGIYLGSKFETSLISEGHARYTYPEAWERFISHVPEKWRKNGEAITKYYAQQFESKDKKTAQKYADEWTLWELSNMSVGYNLKKLEQDVLGDENNLPLAKIEAHYFLNDCFMPENYILDNVDKIKHLPLYVVQGRFDNCTPPVTAHKLAKAYGKNMTLQMVNAGHRRSDPEQFAALTAASNLLFT
ncbi:MAG: prolyl aminopeptidase [Candidatus Saccharibacteria bacterium]|nr:prolyl aminopeptidase [Candidatus Saccharibacteria bacterium]